MKIRKLVAATAVAALSVGFGAAANAALIKTDIIMIVDESGSMGSVQANLRNNIGQFASILSAGGIDARYGLVGYGSSTVAPRMLTDLTDSASFAIAAQGLLINGGTEPGYTATSFALNELDNQASLFSYRGDSVKNLIILFHDSLTDFHFSNSITGIDTSISLVQQSVNKFLGTLLSIAKIEIAITNKSS